MPVIHKDFKTANFNQKFQKHHFLLPITINFSQWCALWATNIRGCNREKLRSITQNPNLQNPGLLPPPAEFPAG